MKVKILQLLNASESLTALASKELSAVFSFSLAKLIKSVQEEIKLFEETRLKKAQEYGKVNEQENKYEIFPEKIGQFKKELEDLVEQEVIVKGDKIPLNALDKISIEPKHFVNLDWLIEEKE